MIRPEKEDYDLNDHFEAIRLARDLMKYIDYLEVCIQFKQVEKLPLDLVSNCFNKYELELINNSLMKQQKQLDVRKPRFKNLCKIRSKIDKLLKNDYC